MRNWKRPRVESKQASVWNREFGSINFWNSVKQRATEPCVRSYSCPVSPFLAFSSSRHNNNDGDIADINVIAKGSDNGN